MSSQLHTRMSTSGAAALLAHATDAELRRIAGTAYGTKEAAMREMTRRAQAKWRAMP